MSRATLAPWSQNYSHVNVFQSMLPILVQVAVRDLICINFSTDDKHLVWPSTSDQRAQSETKPSSTARLEATSRKT